MAHKKIIIIVAHKDYQPIEYQISKKTFHHAGFEVITASNKKGTATAKDGSTTNATLSVSEIEVQNCDAIVFIGGPGALDNLDTQESYRIIVEAIRAEKLVAAICISTRILAHAGALSSVSATGWDGDDQLSGIYNEYDVNYIKAPVVADQGFVTATGPASAQEFADEIVRQLNL